MIFHLLLLSQFGLGFPDMKSQFFSFGRAFISGLIHSLLLEKHRNNLGEFGILLTKVDIFCSSVWEGVNILPVSTSEPSLYYGSPLAACVPEVSAEVARSQMKRLMAPPPCGADHFLFSFCNLFKVIEESQRGQFIQTIAKWKKELEKKRETCQLCSGFVRVHIISLLI